MLLRHPADQPGHRSLTFTLPADHPAGTISVVGNFNAWTPGVHALEPDGGGAQSVTVVVPDDYVAVFRYLGRDGWWFDEPEADVVDAGGSVVWGVPAEPDAAEPDVAEPDATGQSAARPAVEQPDAEQADADHPAAEQPAAEQPAAEQPAADRSSEQEPAAEQGWASTFGRRVLSAAERAEEVARKRAEKAEREAAKAAEKARRKAMKWAEKAEKGKPRRLSKAARRAESVNAPPPEQDGLV